MGTSLLLAQGVPAPVVVEILGHPQISITLNTYAHVAPEVSRRALTASMTRCGAMDDGCSVGCSADLRAQKSPGHDPLDGS
jgi:hypothetical protein